MCAARDDEVKWTSLYKPTDMKYKQKYATKLLLSNVGCMEKGGDAPRLRARVRARPLASTTVPKRVDIIA